VRWKCFLGFSSDDAFSFDCRFEWMSSMRPLRYFVVTCSSLAEGGEKEAMGAYSIVLLIKVVDVSVQDLDE
jgi:hypothetical protein